MLTILKNFFTPPSYDGNPEKTQDAKTVHNVALALLGLAFLSIPFILLLEEPTQSFALYATIIGMFLWLYTIHLVKRERTNIAKFIILIVNTSNIAAVIYATGGLTRPTIYTTIFLMAMANLLFPRKGAFFYSVALLIISSTILGLGIIGSIPEPTIPDSEFSNFLIYVFTLIASAIVLTIAAENTQRSTEIAQQNAEELQRRNNELNRLRGNLESRVTERTNALKKRASQLGAVAEISQTISSLQERERLFAYLTETISEKLGYYHVALFLLDSEKEFAVLRAASSIEGQKMLAEKHKLRVDTASAVGATALRGQSQIILDIHNDTLYTNNVHLPESQSEIALSLHSGGEIFGVLDVQSKEEYAFFTEDVEVLSTLTGQVSAVIENARLFEETQKALAQAEQVIRQFTKSGWAQYTNTTKHKGMLFTGKEIRELSEVSDSEDIQNVFQTKEIVETEETFAVPVKVRGQTIGVLGFRSKDGPRKWSQEEIALMQSAAERSALALENARLLDDAQRRSSKEQAIGEASARIRETLDIESVLETAAQELHKILGKVETEIWLDAE